MEIADASREKDRSLTVDRKLSEIAQLFPSEKENSIQGEGGRVVRLAPTFVSEVPPLADVIA
jgi:hypothetical protein